MSNRLWRPTEDKCLVVGASTQARTRCLHIQDVGTGRLRASMELRSSEMAFGTVPKPIEGSRHRRAKEQLAYLVP